MCFLYLTLPRVTHLVTSRDDITVCRGRIVLKGLDSDPQWIQQSDSSPSCCECLCAAELLYEGHTHQLRCLTSATEGRASIEPPSTPLGGPHRFVLLLVCGSDLILSVRGFEAHWSCDHCDAALPALQSFYFSPDGSSTNDCVRLRAAAD